ncbi:MAG: hypothetical protein COA79_24285 [Planctomycetota bacterium]|nr:MAG: hypothetical protein COA79_24285 [Planctomycetota bacterium]
MSFEFYLPELGEGITSGTVIALSYEPGDKVSKDDSILELETDKAAMGIPSPIDGTLVKYCVEEGADIKIGDLLAVFEETLATPYSETSIDVPGIRPEADPETNSEDLSMMDTAVIDSLEETNLVEVYLPELGEGIIGGAVISLYVKEGDDILEGDPLVELETDKAAMSIPSPMSGKVITMNVADGQEIKIGDLIGTIESSGISLSSHENKGEVTVYEVAEIEIADEGDFNSAETQESPVSEKAKHRDFTTPILDDTKKVVRAGPATRKFARELGIDLSLVVGSKRNGRIDVPDLKSYVKQNLNKSTMGSAAGNIVNVSRPLPDFSKFGPINREPLSKIRKIVSERMSSNWNTIPHVFQFQDIDITGITGLQKKFGSEFKEKGSTASPTNFFIKAMVNCLQEFPKFNSSIDLASGELILKEYFNIGVAVDTPAGLIVPVLKGVDNMSIFEIGKNLRDIAKRGRDRKIMPDEMTGASMTLSNLGGIGGTQFTPIVNLPEVAILGIARSQMKPVFINNEFVARNIVTICLSYDHRVIDGADAARYVVKFKDLIENYEKTLMGVV